MTRDDHHLAGAYALDALTGEERREYEAHYPSCEICTAEVAEFRATATHLAEASPVTPPPELRERVLAEIATTRQLPPSRNDGVVDLAERRRARLPILSAVAAAVIVAIVASVISLGLGSDQRTVEDLIAAPDAVITSLDGDAGVITVVWSPDQERVAVIGNNPPDPGTDTGKAYQLWFILDEGVAPAGLFTPHRGTVGQVIDINDVAAQGWGITIEPAAGSDQPTGDILYAASI